MHTSQSNQPEMAVDYPGGSVGPVECAASSDSQADVSPADLTVFYDGACPLCRREIALYQNSTGARKICWTDVSRVQGDLVMPGLSKDQALARFHVMQRNGTIVSGAEAFVTLWNNLPKFRFLAAVRNSKSIMRCLERAYIFFLHVRPTMQRIVDCLDKKK